MADQKTPPEGEEQITPGVEAPEVVGVKEEEAPTPVTFSQEDIDKLKAEWNTKRQEHETRHKEELDVIRKQSEEAIRLNQERQDQDFLRKVEEDGGDIDAAKRIIAREQAVREREQKGQSEAQTIQSQRAELDGALKAIAANKLATEHGVDVNELMKAQNPTEMENIALKLQLEKQKTESKPPIKTDSGVSTTKGVDLSGMSADEKIRKGIGDMNL